MTETPPKPNRLIRFFATPAVGIIGSVASVVGVGLAVFFYFSERASRDLTCYVHPVRATVVKMGQSSCLSVNLGGEEIESDVSAAQVAIWNRGDLSIRPDNVLKAVTITTPGVRILEASIRKQSRDVVNLRLNTSELESGRLGILWDILEQNDGGVIQIIYAAAESALVEVEGVVEGQRHVSRVKYSGTLRKPQEQYRSGRRMKLIMGWTQIGYIFLLGVPVGLRYVRRRRRPSRRILVMYGIISVVMLSGGVYLLLTAPDMGPPFGF